MNQHQLVRITIDDFFDEARVYSPFEAKDLIKTMPDRRWSGARKAWVIPIRDVPDLEAVLRAGGFRVIVTGAGQRSRRQRDPGPAPSRTPDTSWCDLMFVDLGPDLGYRAYKALSRVLHPDVDGGSAEAMKTLNSARDRYRGLAGGVR